MTTRAEMSVMPVYQPLPKRAIGSKRVTNYRIVTDFWDCDP
jgi:hypothetical protein